MNRYEQLDQALEEDPLGQRLLHVQPPPARLNVPSVALCRSVARRTRRANSTRRWAVAVAAGVCLGLLAINPVAQTTARSILQPGLQQAFGVVSGSPSKVPAPRSPSQGQLITPDLSLAQAQAELSFTIPQLTPPATFTFRGALVDTPGSVYLKYTSGNKVIGLWVRSGEQAGGPAVPSGSLIPITVKGAAGDFVRGTYTDNGPGTVANWDPNVDVQELTWSSGGLTFDLTCANMGLSKQAAVALAAQLVKQ